MVGKVSGQQWRTEGSREGGGNDMMKRQTMVMVSGKVGQCWEVVEEEQMKEKW